MQPSIKSRKEMKKCGVQRVATHKRRKVENRPFTEGASGRRFEYGVSAKSRKRTTKWN